MKTQYEVIRRPIISEKSTVLAELGNKVVFEVNSEATKHEIRDSVQSLFKVNVKSVRTLIVHGKVKRVGRFETKKPNWKKAIVTLAEGQKIDFFQTK